MSRDPQKNFLTEKLILRGS